jgi:glycosyltransferase involved in cell wall biosynthesis
LELTKIFPEAPIYTFLYDQEKMDKWFFPERVRPSFLQKFPHFLRRRHKWFLPLMATVPETFDLREFDLVVSSSSAFAKGVIVRPKTVHISYCHNTARFLWDYSAEYLSQQKLGLLRQILVDNIFSYLRLWDRTASKRVDYFVANSKATASRIKKYYSRDAKVIYPPVNLTNQWSLIDGQKPGDYFLIVSQLVSYKKINVAVKAFNKLRLPLVIIGEGPQEEELRSVAGPNIKILGWQSDQEIAGYYKNCYAFVFPGEDDFGIAPVEAMSYGKPVLAFNAGGAQETILPGMTGEFFQSATPEVLADGVRRLRENYKNYSPLVIRKWAEKFSTERFRNEMIEFIKKVGYN